MNNNIVIPRFGTVKDLFPRGQVFRGKQSMSTNASTTALPVSEGADIWQGMLMSPVQEGGVTKWRVGVPDTGTNLPSIAQTHSWDSDVLAARNMVGLSCLESAHRFGTPFFMRCATTVSVDNSTGAITYTKDASGVKSYPIGTALTWCKDDEVDCYTKTKGGANMFRSARGFIRPAKTGEPVLGVVSDIALANNGKLSYLVNSGDNTIGMGAEGAWDLRIDANRAVESHSERFNAFFVVWNAHYVPTAPTA